MPFYRDWKFWMFVMAGMNTFLTVFSLLIIKFNDFKHVGAQLTNVEKRLTGIEDKQASHGEAIASMKGKCEERGKVLENLQKPSK